MVGPEKEAGTIKSPGITLEGAPCLSFLSALCCTVGVTCESVVQCLLCSV